MQTEADIELIKKVFDKDYISLVMHSFELTNDIDVAKDMVSTTFEKLLSGKVELINYASTKSFAYLATRNATVDWIRAVQRHEKAHKEYGYLCDVVESNPPINRELIKFVYDKIDQLPKKTRAVLNLCLQGNGTNQICEKLGISINNCLNTKYYGIKLIKYQLECLLK